MRPPLGGLEASRAFASRASRGNNAALMRGFQGPSLRHESTDTQKSFRSMSRGRQSKIAKAAQTTLVKAHQWARGEGVEAPVAEALDAGVKSVGAKKK